MSKFYRALAVLLATLGASGLAVADGAQASDAQVAHVVRSGLSETTLLWGRMVACDACPAAVARLDRAARGWATRVSAVPASTARGRAARRAAAAGFRELARTALVYDRDLHPARLGPAAARIDRSFATAARLLGIGLA